MAVSSSTQALTKIFEAKGRQLKLLNKEVIESTDTADKLCLIKSGYAKKYLILNDGAIRTQIIYGPGDIFPLTVAFKTLLNQDLYTGPETYYYETMGKSDILTLDMDALANCVEDDVTLYHDFFSEAGRRLYDNIQRLENLSLSSFYNRVAHQIAFYAHEFGSLQGNQARLNIPLTQQDLADVLSTTRETVSLCMSELKKKGIIKSGKYIIVNDIHKLKQEAYG